MRTHKKHLKEADSFVQKESKKVQQTKWALQYHVAPPAYWMNDPNGFSFYKGEYHLFYQHHPYSPEWGPMYWGHVKSKDLVTWTHMPIALAPSEEYDIDGCFSGSAIEKDGKLYIMYTGNKWTGKNHDTDLEQVQCLAISEDGIHFQKVQENPVISRVPEGDIHPFHIRDPKVWKYKKFFYCVLGSRTKDHIGQVLLYRSIDLINWEFLNVLTKGEGNLGYMWECPDLFNLDSYDVLVFSPQGVKSEGYLYHNVHQSGYMLGKLNYESGIFKHRNFKLLDYGFDVYAPQTMIDNKGRRIMIAWMTMWESDMPEQKDNWAGAMTIPRQLSIEDEKLLCRPVAELAELREEEIAYEQILFKGEKSLEGISGDCYELQVTFDIEEASNFGINIRTDGDANEKTIISYDKDSGFLTLDRNKSGKGPGGVRRAPVELEDEKLHLQIYVDLSSIEVFINNGEKVMTARIYPGENSKGIIFFSNKNVKIETLKKWNLKKAVSFIE